MKSALLALTSMLVFASCKPQKHDSAAPTASRELTEYFPLLPMIEKSLWSQLIDAEAKLVAAPESEREIANQEITRLAEKLRSKHPFKAAGGRMELGGIIFDKDPGKIYVPARVEFPDSGDERHPGEVELLLCTQGGRLHETLFVTDARPLHLELMMHLAGLTKGPQGNRFRIEVLANGGVRIPVESLVRATGGERLASPLLWEFSGSDYKDLYAPDLSGDFAIFWHAHDSVLRVAHEGIASGVVKLAPVPHPKLVDGDSVMLELMPISKQLLAQPPLCTASLRDEITAFCSAPEAINIRQVLASTSDGDFKETTALGRFKEFTFLLRETVTDSAATDLGAGRLAPAQALDVIFARALHDPILFHASNGALGIAIKTIG